MFNQKIEDAKNKIKNFWTTYKREIVIFGVGVIAGVIAEEIRYSTQRQGEPIENGYRAWIVDRDGHHEEHWNLYENGNKMEIDVSRPSIPAPPIFEDHLKECESDEEID